MEQCLSAIHQTTHNQRVHQRMMRTVSGTAQNLLNLTDGIPAQIPGKADQQKGKIRSKNNQKGFPKSISAEKMLLSGSEIMNFQKEPEPGDQCMKQYGKSCQRQNKFDKINHTSKAPFRSAHHIIALSRKKTKRQKNSQYPGRFPLKNSPGHPLPIFHIIKSVCDNQHQ